MNNPHDKFFKAVIGDVNVARDFLKHYLPGQVTSITELSTLKPEKDSFIDGKLKENFSDLLFTADIDGKEGYFYFLFEHKSYKSDTVLMQLLKYMAEIWIVKKNSDNKQSLPIIIPIVFHHGRHQWNISHCLGDMLKDYHKLSTEIQRYIPNYEYIYINPMHYTDNQINGGAELRIYLTICRDILHEDPDVFLQSFFSILEYLSEIENQEKKIVFFEILIRYILQAARNLRQSDLEKVRKVVEHKYPEGSDIIMTMADMFREEGMTKGMAKGMTKGVTKGKEEEKKTIARNLLLKGFAESDIVEVTGLDMDEVKRLKRTLIQ